MQQILLKRWSQDSGISVQRLPRSIFLDFSFLFFLTCIGSCTSEYHVWRCEVASSPCAIWQFSPIVVVSLVPPPSKTWELNLNFNDGLLFYTELLTTVYRSTDYSIQNYWLQYTELLITVYRITDYSIQKYWLQYTELLITAYRSTD
jgi:hypothetical protein